MAGQLSGRALPASVSDGQILQAGAGGGAWAGVALPGGGSDGETSLYVSADQAITVTGFVDITGLSFAVAANKAYLVEGQLFYTTSTTAMGCWHGFTGPASPALIGIRTMKEITASGSAGTDKFSEVALINGYDTANPASTAEPSAAPNILLFEFRGVFVNGANSGTFKARMSKENVAGTHTIKIGSWLRYRLLN